MKKRASMRTIVKQRFPSLEFSAHTGIPDLHFDWKLSKDTDELYVELVEFYDTEDNTYPEKLSAMYNQIIKDNPQLANIKLYHPLHSKADVIMGVISKFNYDDIKFFTEIGAEILEYNFAIMDHKHLVDRTAGIYSGWVMSPTTLNKVIKALNLG